MCGSGSLSCPAKPCQSVRGQPYKGWGLLWVTLIQKNGKGQEPLTKVPYVLRPYGCCAFSLRIAMVLVLILGSYFPEVWGTRYCIRRVLARMFIPQGGNAGGSWYQGIRLSIDMWVKPGLEERGSHLYHRGETTSVMPLSY